MFTLELKARGGGMLPAARLSFVAGAKGTAATSAVAVSSLDGELVWASYACPKVRSCSAAPLMLAMGVCRSAKAASACVPSSHERRY